jgi:hypothetical protein
MTTAEKDIHYGNLNRRFDRRAAELRELGFTYKGIDQLGAEGHSLAVFTRPERFKPGKHETVAAGFVLTADPIIWEDTIDRFSRNPIF